MMAHYYNCLFLFTVLLPYTCSQDAVHVKSPYGLGLTSSTLRWTSAFIDTDSAEIDGVTVNGEAGGVNSSYICRARHGGHNIIGSTHARLCQIAYFGEVFSYPSFEVLTNPSSFARLDWQLWTRFYLIPDGALETRLSYVSRFKVDDVYYGGRLDSTLGRGKLLTVIDGVVKETTEGEILVETEPIAYEITDFKYTSGTTKLKILVDEEVLLDEATLSNEESDSTSTVSTIVSYDIPYKVYLAHVRGLVKGLNTTISLSTLPGPITTNWGREVEGKFSRQTKEVSYELAKGTLVNLTLTGRRIVQEAPYTAKLFAKYPDGKEVIHNLEGVMKTEWVTQIKVEYTHPHFIANNTLAPTTQRTTTTTSEKKIRDYSDYDYMDQQNDDSDAVNEDERSKDPYSLQAYSGSRSVNSCSFTASLILLLLYCII
ncbi:protein unzipped-like isoform X2 [Artemia franciscana]|uniref:Uncharacterized protein n=1 Tax=Artemia franciscana TaxID=6661 RepID=A0AA88HZT5_ARTSF|nr:hypothetical protein QYM36_006216 [Artemia franciscana]